MRINGDGSMPPSPSQSPRTTKLDPVPNFADVVEQAKSLQAEPRDVLYQNGISDTDLHQDGLNDCFLISPLGEIAKNDPGFIRQMIHANGNGTYTVTLHEKDPNIGNLWGLFKDNKTVKETVSVGDFSKDSVNSSPGQDASGGEKEIWPQVIEAAYAKFIGGGNVNKGYQDLRSPKGGVPSQAMFTLTGQNSSQTSPPSFQQLQSDLQQGKLVTFDTPNKNNLGYNLVAYHSYMVVGISTDSHGNRYVELRNPWGDHEPQKVPVSAWDRVFDATDVGSA
jgi:hypothetical protein